MDAAVNALLNAPADLKQAALKTLKVLLSNLIKDPSNSKFHKVRSTNKKIKESVIDVPGAVAFLEALGFQNKGGVLELDPACIPSVSDLKTALEELSKHDASSQSLTQVSPSPATSQDSKVLQLLGNQFLGKNGIVDGSALSGKVIGIYFSAHW
jgi:hypothetical protein